MKRKAWASWLIIGAIALSQTPTITVALEAVTPAQISEVAARNIKPIFNEVLVLTRSLARREILALPAVARAARNEREAFDEWQNAIGRARTLDTEKVTFTNPWTGETDSIRHGDETQMRLRMQKYLLPEQMEFGYEMSRMSSSLAVQSLENAMDGMLLSIFAAQNDIEAKQASVALASERLSRTRALFTAGRALDLDVDTDTLALRRAEAVLSASVRSHENLSRNYNRFVAKPIDRQFVVHLSPSGILPQLTAEAYVAEALENRVELFRLRENVRLSERRAEMLTFLDLHTRDENIKLERERVLLEVESTKAAIENAQLSIAAEIRSSLLRLRIADIEIAELRQHLVSQQSAINSMQNNILAGRLAAWTDDSLVVSIEGMENQLEIVRVSLDNNVRNFRQATGVGPAANSR